MEDYSLLLEQILQQEQELQFDTFSNGTAIQVGSAILARAQNMGKLITIDIRMNGTVLFHAKMDNNGPGNDHWINRKINAVNHFGHCSYYVHVLLKSRNTTLQESAFVDPLEYAAEGGCFPLQLRSAGTVGTISVSGLAGEEDHEMIVAVLKQILKQEAR
ncbi:heme-degrading domain-containing protein [Paenibacillus sp. MMS20-IR301]|uniref:heme-degrading domain-containing protein n=1 Tax=Paenibacillus sp. MMS20-IR301 TaxID=2895946 RepID=UPI0028E5A0F8|nr:heme-degrading domain-containing protein [Paenibacillus sp. MMS20-IR301]WNS44617.1 heme-degrading domain-containing protein [Paenibacillus sp. MMS20-IR301]